MNIFSNQAKNLQRQQDTLTQEADEIEEAEREFLFALPRD